MKIVKKASVVWSGDLKEGKGSISTESGALAEQPYGFNTRFTGGKGTNPEELIGAAHAACFTMALSKILGESNFTAEQMDTKSEITLEKIGEGFEITASHLILKAKINGIDAETFKSLADKAKTGCPVSKLLKCKISMDASLT